MFWPTSQESSVLGPRAAEEMEATAAAPSARPRATAGEGTDRLGATGALTTAAPASAEDAVAGSPPSVDAEAGIPSSAPDKSAIVSVTGEDAALSLVTTAGGSSTGGVASERPASWESEAGGAEPGPGTGTAGAAERGSDATRLTLSRPCAKLSAAAGTETEPSDGLK